MSAIDHLAALLGHLKRHPHLTDTFDGVNHSRTLLGLQVYPYHREDDFLGALAIWARTLTDCEPVSVRVADSGQLHLHLVGKLADGTPVKVACLPTEDEADLLAVNIRVDEGDRLPVDLLLRLTSTADAEAVARG